LADEKIRRSPALDASGVRVAIDGRTIVDDITLAVAAGEFVGIVGPNGSGKSTLLKACYKIVRPIAGDIHLGGIDVVRSRPAVVAKELAVVSQFQEMSFNLSIRELVALGRAPHRTFLQPGDGGDGQIVAEALATVGMADDAERSIQTVSGGERQRVALARALAQQPSFLILDEPTNHLDVRHQLHVLDLVRSLGIGVLAALHDLHLAARYCDRVAVIDAGRMVAQGDPAVVLTPELIRQVYHVECETYADPHGHLAFSYLGPVAAADMN
jgi:iron complex transport system ATP-binding protein